MLQIKLMFKVLIRTPSKWLLVHKVEGPGQTYGLSTYLGRTVAIAPPACKLRTSNRFRLHHSRSLLRIPHVKHNLNVRNIRQELTIHILEILFTRENLGFVV